MLSLCVACTAAQAAPPGLAAKPVEAWQKGGGQFGVSASAPHSDGGKHRSGTSAGSPALPTASRANEPFPYTYVGAVGEEGGQRQIVLERDARMFLVGRGDVLARAYRIRAIGRDGVDVFFLATQTRRLVPFAEIAPPAGPNEGVAAQSQSAASDHAGGQMSDPAQRRDLARLEDLMGMRPPGEVMETRAPSPRGHMVALPPSEQDVQDTSEH